jgi:hypothetical protein
MKKLLLTSIAMLLMVTGTTHAQEQGPLWISAAKISSGQLNGIWWQGMNGAGSFVRWYPSREETTDFEVKEEEIFYQDQKCETKPYNCPILGLSGPGEMCGIALPRRNGE